MNKHQTGIVVLGSDERNPRVRLAPLRFNFYHIAPEGYIPFDAYDPPLRRDISGIYLGFVRWHVWLYFRRRYLDQNIGSKWFSRFDTQTLHEYQEASRNS